MGGEAEGISRGKEIYPCHFLVTSDTQKHDVTEVMATPF